MIRFLTKILTVWAILIAGINLFAGAGTALRFNGTNAVAAFPLTAGINPYPLTVSAWFRTESTLASPEIIAAKYVDGSLNGWSIQMENGFLHSYYFRNA